MTAVTARTSLNGLPAKHGTTILLQHNGLPRTPFYTQRHLKSVLDNFGCPSLISGSLAPLRYRYSKKIQLALRESSGYSPLEEQHRRFGIELSKKLGKVLPEFGPFTTRFSYLYHEPYIVDVVEDIINQGTDSLIAISLYPFEIPHNLKPMQTATTNALNKFVTSIYDYTSDRQTYFAKNAPTSFNFHRLDSIGTHPSFIQYWTERLVKNLTKSDSIVFAVPMPLVMDRASYYETVYSVVKRLVDSCHVRLSHAISYRIAFYSTWDNCLPITPLAKSISNQIKCLFTYERHSPLVVPFGSLFKDFDTESLLRYDDTLIKVLRPDEQDNNLVHSFVEMLKSQILTEKYESDKTPADPIF